MTKVCNAAPSATSQLVPPTPMLMILPPRVGVSLHVGEHVGTRSRPLDRFAHQVRTGRPAVAPTSLWSIRLMTDLYTGHRPR